MKWEAAHASLSRRWGSFLLRLMWAPVHALFVITAPVLVIALTLITLAGLLMIAFYAGLLGKADFPWGMVLGVSTLSAMLAVALQDVLARLRRL